MKQPFADAESGRQATTFGLTLFLVSLGVLFAATIVGIIVLRVKLNAIWPTDLPRWPPGLGISTAILVVSVVTMRQAVRAERQGRSSRPALWITTGLGLLFLASQAWSWATWFRAVAVHWAGSESWRVALTGFYVLTGLHAVHVVGGLVALSATLIRPRPHAARYAAMYWDFLAVAWLVILGVLLLVR